MNAENCTYCGAQIINSRFICPYCGSYISQTHSPQEEKSALIELHSIIVQSPKEKQIDIIRNGFLPDNTPVLIDAGVRTVAMIDTKEPNDDRNLAAVSRLESIILKLSFAEKNNDTTYAIKVFKNTISKFNRYDRLITGVAIIIILMIIAAIAYAVYRIVR